MIDIQKLEELAKAALAENAENAERCLKQGIGFPSTVRLSEYQFYANPAAVLELIAQLKVALVQLDLQRELNVRRFEEIEQLRDTLEGRNRLCPCGYETCILHMWPPRVPPLVRGLRVENEALRKDAERYRWLRAQHWNTGALAVATYPQESIKLGFDCPSGERLDQQIDALIEQELNPCAS